MFIINKNIGIRMIDDKLAQFATDRQWEYYSKSCELGSNRAAAKLFNVSATVVDVSIRSLKAKAAQSVWAMGKNPRTGQQARRDGAKLCSRFSRRHQRSSANHTSTSNQF
jgi:hypothetical protein